ncbi:MAG: hypothetical protein JXQ75_22975 [Phycisphaerae bacterium]|nr:hypothetical protein [Phycisphaerae bacterium]
MHRQGGWTSRKTFDCVEMKRNVEQQIHEETRNLSREQEIEYYHAAAEAFWREIRYVKKAGSVRAAANTG